MNISRAVLFGLFLYIAAFVSYSISLLLPWGSSEELVLSNFIVMWLINIPVILLLAKWYFKKDQPTGKKGFLLGVIAIVVALVLDGVFVSIAWGTGQSLDQFKELYGSWMFYITLVEILLLTSLAGGEFDGTYTKRPSSKEQS